MGIANGAMTTPFARHLKRTRESRRLSQEKAASLGEMDHSLWSRLESCAREPTRNAIRKIGSGLELTPLQVDQMLILAGFMPDDPIAVVDGDPVVAQLYRVLNDDTVSPATRQTIREATIGLLRVVQQTVYRDGNDRPLQTRRPE